jgi:dihydrolipoamide dehydrogenase
MSPRSVPRNLKQKVAIVDKQWMGGVCLNVGCIPSKSLLKNAEVAHTLRERGKDFGFSFENLETGLQCGGQTLAPELGQTHQGRGFLMKKNNIAVFMGEAKFKTKDTVNVTDKDGKVTELKAKNIIVATGASAMVPARMESGRREGRHLLGGDPANDIAQVCGGDRLRRDRRGIFHDLDAYGVDVTIVEMLPRVVPLEDEEVSKELEKEFKKRGSRS